LKRVRRMKWGMGLGAILIAAVGLVGGVILAKSQSERERPRILPKDHNTPVMYVALGDSTVSGVGASSPEKNYVSRLHAQLRSVYPNAALANLGVSGATSADVVRDQLPHAVALHPYLVTLSIGPNDVVQGQDAQQYEQNIEIIFQTLSRATQAVVVANLLPDMAVSPRFTGDEKDAVRRQTELFNEVLARQGQRYGVEIVDLYGPSQEEVPGHKELFSGDEYHPSDEGYARWADHMWRGVDARIQR
jgi:acyl-CoA thioesterase I